MIAHIDSTYRSTLSIGRQRSKDHAGSVLRHMMTVLGQRKGDKDTKDATIMTLTDIACSIARRSAGQERKELPLTGLIAKKYF